MTQILLLLSDPEVWKLLTVGLIVVIVVGEFIAKMFPYER
jgi:uncharacterized protein YjgD (DUF1641 family)